MANFKKGSPEAKAYMAKLRAAKGKTKPVSKVGYKSDRIQVLTRATPLIKKYMDKGYTRKEAVNSANLDAAHIIQSNMYKMSGTKTKAKKETSMHKDSKSHNVNIKVMSGTKKISGVYENEVPTGKKMYAKINEYAYIYAGNSGSNKLGQYLKDNKNKWIEIDTNFLFDDQYNTTSGYRIYDTMISAIKNDARIGVKQFEESNDCCFLKWNGIKPTPRPLPKDLPKNIAKIDPQFKDEYQIGTYRLNIINQHYCLRNARQNIKFLFFEGAYFLTTGIGYRYRSNLSGSYPISYAIPADVKKKVLQIMNTL
jgi:hypothetical protein